MTQMEITMKKVKCDILQILSLTLLLIDQHHHVTNHQPGIMLRRGGFQNWCSASNKVLNDQVGLVLDETPSMDLEVL